MKKWEDIVKDKLEGYESALPEGDLAEFRALRAGKARAGRKVAPWIWGTGTAIAAGLAAVFFLRQPAVSPDEGIHLVPQPPVSVAMVTAAVPEPEAVSQIPVRKALPVQQAASMAFPQAGIQPAEMPSESVETIESKETEAPKETIEPDQSEATASPIVIPEKTGARHVTIKVWPAAGAVAGGGLLATVLTPVLGGDKTADMAATPPDDVPFWGTDPASPKDVLAGSVHHMPVKVGVSARFPLAERLSLTTGLQYALYRSTFRYSLSGEKMQFAHYLGIPVRLDWAIASGRWFDVYAGGGVEGDACLGAFLAGNKVEKDGFGLSLLGAGGVQMRVSRRIGLYMEPEVSWQIPVGRPVLETYRSEHPLMFSVAAGLRVNIEK